MRPLSDTNMIKYMQSEQIDPYNISGNVFGNNHAVKNSIVDFSRLPVYEPKLHPAASTFELNGHEAAL